MTGEFPAQKVSKAENVSIWWRYHEAKDGPTSGKRYSPETSVDIMI